MDQGNFSTIGREWNRLLQDSGSDSVFLKWEWIYTWWQVFGDDSKELYILTAHDAGGQLVGIAPCYLAHWKECAPLLTREIRFLGCGENISPEYLDFITAREARTRVVNAFFNYFFAHKADWDVLNLTDLLESSAVLEHVKELQARKGLHLIKGESACCPYALLPDNWESYIDSLSKNMRYSIRRKIRKLDRNFNVNFYSWSDADTLSYAMSRLAELHRKRWSREGIRHSFSDPKFNGFHYEVARKFHQLGLLRLYALELNETIVAMLYCFKYAGKLFYYQSGFDPGRAEYGVGTVLFARAIQAAIGEHIREFDFLRGYHRYKYDWATAERTTVRLAVRRNSLPGAVYVLHQFGPDGVKDYLRKRLPPKAYQFLKNARIFLFANQRKSLDGGSFNTAPIEMTERPEREIS